MAAGHAVDANTFALWRFDETNVYSTVVANAGGTPNLTAASQQSIVKGPAGIGQYARRWHTGINNAMTATPTAAQLTAARASWTVEFWVNIHDLTTANYIVCMSGDLNLDSLASNCLFRISTGQHSGSTYKIDNFWEKNSAGDNVFMSSSGAALQIDQWYHIAVRKTVTATEVTVDYFFSGVLDSSSIIPLADNAQGGTASMQWAIGRNANVSAGPYSDMDLCELKFSDNAQSDATILANATRSTKTHIVDGNTLALWRFDDLPAAVDIVGGNHLLQSAGYISKSAPLIVDGGYSKYFDSTGNAPLVCGQSPQLRTFWKGEWTVETWIRVGDLANAERAVIGFCGDFNVEPAENANYLAYISITGFRRVRVFWEHTGGANVDFTFTYTFSSVFVLEKFHLAVRKRLVSANAYALDLYIDGLFVESSSSNYPTSTGGDLAQATNNNLMIGSGGGNSPSHWYGYLDDMRLSPVVRTSAEILDSYNRGTPVYQVVAIFEESGL